MNSQEPRIDAYIERAAPFAQPLLKHWRALVHEACPEVQETIKWSMPFFTHGERILAQMAAFKAHCAFGIYAGEAVNDRERNEEAMGNFGRITALSDLPPKKELIRLLKAGVTAIDSGERAPRSRKNEPKPPPVLPPDLAEALAANADAKRHFEGFSPSHKREYIDWINDAKQPQTRAKRLATTVEQSAEGKSQNWRYERPKLAAKAPAKTPATTEAAAKKVATQSAAARKTAAKKAAKKNAA